MLIHDRAAATSSATTPEGFLRVQARIGRTGVHRYTAGELGTPDGYAAGDTIRVYRPPGDVFDPDAMASFAGKPVTDDHPPEMVDATNWKRYAIGHSGAAVTRDGDHLLTDLLITDADAVRRARDGVQLSNGYLADFDFTPGTTPEGDPYDAVQKNIRGNHIALVDAGRCGDTCRIGDAVALADCGCGPAAQTPALTIVTIEGIDVETSAAGADVLRRLQVSIEAKDGAIAALTAKVLDAAAIDALVSERAAVIDAARSALGVTYDPCGASTADIRRAVVIRMLGRGVDERSDAYVAAAFDTLMATRPNPNPLAAHLAFATADAAGGRDTARQTRDRFLNHAWKGQTTIGDR